MKRTTFLLLSLFAVLLISCGGSGKSDNNTESSVSILEEVNGKYSDGTLTYELVLNGRTPDQATKVSVTSCTDQNATEVVIPSTVQIDGRELTVASIEFGAFSGCEKLVNVTVPNTVTQVSMYAFEYCSNLASVTLPDGLAEIEKRIFYDCKSLSSISIPSGVTQIGSMTFYNCESLASVTIPGSVTYIDNQAFSNCAKLSKVVCLGTVPPEVPTIDSHYIFGGCDALKEIHVKPGCKAAYEAAKYWNQFTIVEDAE